MRFVETPVFTRLLRQHLSDDAYRTVQLALALRPEQGPVIRGSGGLRKLRCAPTGRGKSGGIRLIYYWDPPETIYMLFLYPKGRQSDLSPDQLRQLSKIVREEFK